MIRFPIALFIARLVFDVLAGKEITPSNAACYNLMRTAVATL